MFFRLLLALHCVVIAGAAPGLERVVLDPGHGGTNQGAPNPRNARFEKHYTLPIATRVARHLRAAGVEVKLTRTRDRYVSLAGRTKMANKQRADLFVSIHLNSSEAPGPSGFETYLLSLDATDEAARRLAAFENMGAKDSTTTTANTAVDRILLDLSHTQAHRDSAKLAAFLQKRLAVQSPYADRGVNQAPFVVLMGAAMPAVVCEVGFINHPKEGRFITSRRGHERISRGIADGILDFGRLVLAPREQRSTNATTPGSPRAPDL